MNNTVKLIKSNHLSNNIVHVIKEEVNEGDTKKMKIFQACVFQNNIFILKSQEDTMYT